MKTYSTDGTDFVDTLGPTSTVVLKGGAPDPDDTGPLEAIPAGATVIGRQHVVATYDEAKLDGATYHLATSALTGNVYRVGGGGAGTGWMRRTSDGFGGVVAELVKIRRLTDQEGQQLQRIVRRGSTNTVRYRRAMMLLASAGGNRVPVIAQLVQADEDTVRDVIHRFNQIGPACLDPRWAGGRPRLLSPDDPDGHWPAPKPS